MNPEKSSAGSPLEELYKSIRTFGNLAVTAESRDKLYRYNDALMQSLYSILDDKDCDVNSKMQYFVTTMEQYANAMLDLFPKLLGTEPDKLDQWEFTTQEDTPPKENPIGKSDPNRFDVIQEIEKFNPYHDSKGRFSTADGAASFTYAPGKSKAHDNAIAREKERTSKLPEKPKAPKKPANPHGDPDTIGGAKRGEPMSREEANQNRANPNFSKDYGYRINCQSCVVAYEARLRGYDVQAKANKNNPAAAHLSRATYDAWIDPATGKPPTMQRNDPNSVHTTKQTKAWLEDTIKPGERYTFQHGWKGHGNSGHIISADRDTDGSLRLYDPQVGKTYKGADVDSYLSRIKTSTTIYGTKIGRLGLTRVDNMRINPDYSDGIMEATS